MINTTRGRFARVAAGPGGAGPRVAIVAEHASARFGGEAMLPLQYFRHLRRRGVEAYLIVHSRTKNELDELFPEDRGRVFYVPDSWLHKLLWQIGRPLPDRIRTFTVGWLLHLLTQAYQRPIVRRLVQVHGVDVVHEPIPVSPRMPSLTFGVGAPVIIGPMNGGMGFPPGFRYLESRLERLFLAVGRRLSGLANSLIPGKRRAALLLVANERTRAALPPGVSGSVRVLVDNGIDPEAWHPVERQACADSGDVRFAFVGRLIALKAVDVLIEAFAQRSDRPTCRLAIIGDGPERARLERLCRELQVADRVTFHGFLPHAACRDLLCGADALVLPSVRECGGAVVLEAMALGLPVIVADWGGPADYVRPEYGILVDARDRATLKRGLTRAIQRLAASPAERRLLGARARRVVREHYTWTAKIDRVLALYREVIAGAAAGLDARGPAAPEAIGPAVLAAEKASG